MALTHESLKRVSNGAYIRRGANPAEIGRPRATVKACGHRIRGDVNAHGRHFQRARKMSESRVKPDAASCTSE